MTVYRMCTVARTVALGLSLVLAGAAFAQQAKQPAQPKQAPLQRQTPQPSANALLLAKEIIIAKGAGQIYEPIVPRVIERVRGVFLQQNPMLGRDLTEVATRLRADLSPRTAELLDDAARLYAANFTEQELKDVLAFYKSPLGKKVITEEPAILERSVSGLDAWADKFGQEVMSKFRAEMKKKGHDL